MFIPDVRSSPYRSKTSEICAAFRTLGAVSPEAALPREALVNVDREALDRLVQRGIVRSTPRGSLYLAETAFTRADVKRYAVTLAFWLVLLAIPVLLLKLMR
ncbi:MAG TPA: hypothetical protein VF483_03995 [Gemmatimonadaceae bacterium]